MAARPRIYGLISRLASHPTYSGISLTATGPGNMVWRQEMALRLSPAAVMLMPDAEENDLKLLATRIDYLGVVDRWWSKYRGLQRHVPIWTSRRV
jgi:hypothetical protein